MDWVDVAAEVVCFWRQFRPKARPWVKPSNSPRLAIVGRGNPSLLTNSEKPGLRLVAKGGQRVA